MFSYILKRLFLMFPTLFGILLLTFMIVQVAPGGPVEQLVAELSGHGTGAATARLTGTGNNEILTQNNEHGYKGRDGLDEALVKKIEKIYGFDQPASHTFLEYACELRTF